MIKRICFLCSRLYRQISNVPLLELFIIPFVDSGVFLTIVEITNIFRILFLSIFSYRSLQYLEHYSRSVRSEWLLFNANSAIFSYIMVRTNYFSNRWWWVPFCTRQTRLVLAQWNQSFSLMLRAQHLHLHLHSTTIHQNSDDYTSVLRKQTLKKNIIIVNKN